nr:unnamed protein product [Haemonchus contortus]
MVHNFQDGEQPIDTFNRRRSTIVRCSGIRWLAINVHPTNRIRYHCVYWWGRNDAVVVDAVLLVERPYGEYTANFSAIALFRPTTENSRPFWTYKEYYCDCNCFTFT